MPWRQASACTGLGGCYAAGGAYTALDQPTAVTLGNSLAQTWAYAGPMARLERIRVGPDDARFHRTYAYDNVGNVRTITDYVPSPDQVQTFTYDHRDRLTQAVTSGSSTGAYNEGYSYDQIGNLTQKGATSYAYPAGGANSVRPHAPTAVGGQAYSYDDNGNVLTGGGRTYNNWDAQNQLTSLTSGGTTETYTYDAEGQRVTRVRGTVTTVSLGGLYEEERTSGKTRLYYQLDGRVIAQRERTSATGAGTLLYLHGDHLGSVSLATSTSGTVTARQDYKPYGERRGAGDITQTPRDYTGQPLDATGLLYYGARYYDPALARFVSPDPIVPGVASAKGGAAASLGHDERVALASLTVDFHEPGFAKGVGEEYRFILEDGFWFQLDGEDREAAKVGWGPANPQTLNRYAYALDNPARYTDPTGHSFVEATSGLVTLGLSPQLAVVVVLALGTAAIIDCIGDASCRDAVATEIARPSYGLPLNKDTAPFLLGFAMGTIFAARGEYVPKGLNGEERIRYREAVHAYKRRHKLGSRFPTPEWILDEIADKIRRGASAYQAANSTDAPPEDDDDYYNQ